MTGVSECPTCGDDFNTEQGMKSHHAQIHDESIAGFEYTCEWCGSEGRKKTIEEDDEHQFCDTGCYHEWRSDTLVGENSPVWEGGLVTVECDWCGEPVEKISAQSEYHERDFCSKQCHGDWLSENLREENHPRWNEDSSQINYGPGWKRRREERLELDGYRCTICGMGDDEHRGVYGTSLHVHHVTPVSEYTDSDRTVEFEKAHRLENLITMCVACHRRWEGVQLRPSVVKASP